MLKILEMVTVTFGLILKSVILTVENVVIQGRGRFLSQFGVRIVILDALIQVRFHKINYRSPKFDISAKSTLEIRVSQRDRIDV